MSTAYSSLKRILVGRPPMSLLVVALLAIVVFSYRQTIHAYPNGGGCCSLPPRAAPSPSCRCSWATG